MKLNILCVGIIAICFCCCRQARNRSAVPEEMHWVEVRRSGGERLYIDPVDNKYTMIAADSFNAKTVFISFQVGFSKEKIETDGRKYADLEKYFQYDLDKDWVALAGADTFHTVFYAPKVKRLRQVDEGVLVFEVPKSKQLDTLLFHDQMQGWGTQKIALH